MWLGQICPQHDNNRKANGEPWKSRKSHIGVWKKMEKNSAEKINSSKPWKLDKSANNDDDDVTHWQKKPN